MTATTQIRKSFEKRKNPNRFFAFTEKSLKRLKHDGIAFIDRRCQTAVRANSHDVCNEEDFCGFLRNVFVFRLF